MSNDSRDTEVVSIVLVLAPFVLAGVAAWMLPRSESQPASEKRRWIAPAWFVNKGERWVWGLACVVLFALCGGLTVKSTWEAERSGNLRSKWLDAQSQLAKCQKDYDIYKIVAEVFEEDHRKDLQYLRELARAKGFVLPTDDELARRPRN